MPKPPQSPSLSSSLSPSASPSPSPSVPEPPSSASSKCSRILNKFDLFSYVPEPQAYPVSTPKSKAGSLIFLVIIVGYLTYDFVKFIIANQPNVSSFDDSIPIDQEFQAPQIAFGFIYGPLLNYTLNDPSYFGFQFMTITTDTVNGTSVETKTPQPLTQNCNPQWLGVYNNIYKNLTCINKSLSLVNVPSLNPYSVIQRLLISSCQSSSNITCQNETQLYKMTSGGRLLLIINLPAGFDYKTGTVVDTEYSVQIYQFFLVPGLYNRISINYYPFVFTTYPTYFTSFQQKIYEYMQSYEPLTRLTNVSVFNPSVMLAINFMLYSDLTVVQVKYQTFINRVSEWGALASLIMAIFGICCLTYNKGKFLKKNPGWKNFDQAMRKKDRAIQIQMQNRAFKESQGNGNGDENGDDSQREMNKGGNEQKVQEDDDFNGIYAIRKKLEQQGKNKK